MLSPKYQRSIRVNDGQLIALSDRAQYDHSQNLLFYYESENNTRPTGVLLLEGSYCERMSKAPMERNASFCFMISYRRESQRQYELRAASEVDCTHWVDAIREASFNKLLLQKEELDQKQLHLLQVVESERTSRWQYAQQCDELSSEVKKLRTEVGRHCIAPAAEGGAGPEAAAPAAGGGERAHLALALLLQKEELDQKQLHLLQVVESERTSRWQYAQQCDELSSEKEELDQKQLHLLQVVESERTSRWQYAQQCDELSSEVKKLRTEVGRHCIAPAAEGGAGPEAAAPAAGGEERAHLALAKEELDQKQLHLLQVVESERTSRWQYAQQCDELSSEVKKLRTEVGRHCIAPAAEEGAGPEAAAPAAGGGERAHLALALLLQKEELDQKQLHLLQVVESERTSRWQYAQQCDELSSEVKKLRTEVGRHCIAPAAEGGAGPEAAAPAAGGEERAHLALALLLQKEELDQKQLHLLQVVESERTSRWQYAQQCDELSSEVKKLRTEVGRHCIAPAAEGGAGPEAAAPAAGGGERAHLALALLLQKEELDQKQLHLLQVVESERTSRWQYAQQCDELSSEVKKLRTEVGRHCIAPAAEGGAGPEAAAPAAGGGERAHLALALLLQKEELDQKQLHLLQVVESERTSRWQYAQQCDELSSEVKKLRTELCTYKKEHESATRAASTSSSSPSHSPEIDPAELRKIKKVQSFFRGWLCRRRWKQIVDEYIKSPHAESMRKRNSLVFKMVEAEEEYLEQMEIMVTCFLRPFKMAASSKKPPCTHEDVNSIFLNSETVLFLHQIFFKGLTSRMESWPTLVLGDLFDMLLPMLTIYQEYVRNHHYSLQVLTECKQSQPFAQLLARLESKPACQSRSLETFLTYPMHQIPRYIITLHELLAHTPHDHVERRSLQHARAQLEELSRQMHDEVTKSPPPLK
ncbi:unnamed protein product [Chrysodeixis includens]|uniref:Uncharacterized protein n=1 Tax=Chrysodeixis includens TaxID=689277 RepID=A0A9N8Q1P0_CHRIL|nr:unnamed protein product [Chrysodeixis includens]